MILFDAGGVVGWGVRLGIASWLADLAGYDLLGLIARGMGL